MRRTIAAVITSALVAAFGVGVPTRSVSAAGTPEEQDVAAGAVEFFSALAGATSVDELGENALPFTGILAGGAGGLDAGTVFEALAAGIEADTDLSANELETVIEALNGSDLGGGIMLEIQADVDSGGITFTTLTLTRQDITVPLAYLSGDPEDPATFSLEGGDLDVDLVLDFTANGNVVLSRVGDSLDLAAAAPTAELNAQITLDTAEIATRLGILDVTATGSVAADVTFEIDWLDPDLDGSITEFELTNSSPGDLFDVSIAPGSDVSMDLTLASELDGLGGVSGTIRILPAHDLSSGDLPLPDLQLGELADFTNMTPQDVLAAIAQLAINLRSLQLVTANPDLPLLDENLAEFGDWSDRITNLFVANGLSSAENPVDLQIAPEEGVECDNMVDDDGDGFVNDGCPGFVGDLEAKGLASIEDIITELADSLALGGDDLDLAYADQAVTFTIALSDQDFFAETPGVTYNVAEELKKAGITSLQLGGGATIEVTPSYDVNLTVGLDLGISDPDVPITERVFVVPDPDEPELAFDAPVSGAVELTGRIGMLTLGLSSGGDTQILSTRSGQSEDPMVAVELVTPVAGDRITIADVFDALADVGVLAAGDTLTIDAVPFDVVTTLNLAVPQITLAASGSVGETTLASANVYVEWADLTAGDAPTVTTDTEFNDDFLGFNLDSEDPLALFSTLLAAIDTALSAVEDITGDEIDMEIPVLNTSARDLLSWVDGVQDAITTLASNPTGTLELLELTVEGAIAEALDALDGVDDFQAPEFPDPTDFGLGEDFEPAAYAAALEGYMGLLSDFVEQNGDFVTMSYVEGNSPGALLFELNIGVCSDSTTYAAEGCTFAYPITENFNLDLSQVAGADFGGIVDADATGDVELDYNVSARVHLGVELPEVLPDNDDDGLPEVSLDLPKVFISDTSGIDVSVAGALDNAEFSAALGPFEVQVGETDAFPESGDQCAEGNTDDDDMDGYVNDGCVALPNPEVDGQCAIDDDADDDGDGTVNDGCPTVDTPEADGDCANDTDDDGDGTAGDINDGCPTTGDPEPEDAGAGACHLGDTTDDDGDGLVNDGCPARGNVLVAQAGASLSLANDATPDPADPPARFYLNPDGGDPTIGQFFSGLGVDFGPVAGLTCPLDQTPGTDDFACAHLPIYAGAGDDLTFLGNIDISIDSLDPFNAVIAGDDEILANAQAAIESIVFDLIAEGIRAFGDAVDDGMSAAAYDVQIPVIGDALDAGADIASDFNDTIVQNVADLVDDLNSASDFDELENRVRDFFWDELGGAEADQANRFILNFEDVTAMPDRDDHILVSLLCGGDEHDCDPDDGDTFLDLRGIEIELAIGQTAVGETPDFEWGVPGLRLEGDSTLEATVSWQISLGFGVSLSNGFYILGDTTVNDNVGDRDVSVTAAVDFGTVDVDLDDPAALNGDLAFLSAALWNAKSDRVEAGDGGDTDGRAAHEIAVTFGIDFTDTTGPVGLSQMLTLFNPTKWDVSMDGYVDFSATLATTVAVEGDDAESGVIPRLLADISLEWDFSGSLDDGFEAGNVEAGFDEIRLDLGSFIAEFLAPVLGEVQRFTQPLQPIIDTLEAPIPGVSQLAELVGADPVTLLDLMEAVSGADLTLIRRLLQVITFANSIPTNVESGDESLIIPIGDFLLDSEQLLKSELPSNAKDGLIDQASKNTAPVDGAGGVLSQLGSKSGSTAFADQVDKAASSEGGFSFPAFEDPSKLFNLLVGQDVELVEFDAGPLKAEVGWSQSFGPITLGPVPVSVVVSISAAIEGRFVIGYDTKGIRQLVQNLTDGDDANDDFFESVGTLLAGVYIGDTADDGSDPPEIRLTLEGAVGAAVDLVVLKVGIEAGLRATLDMNLHDGGYLNPVPPENLDGKLRIDEIITFFNNPLCLFDVSGKLEAFIRLFVTLDLFLFEVTYKQTIVNITLLELNNITAELCKPPEPKPATKDGGTLRLNVGDRSGFRDFDEDEGDEKVTIRQLTPGVPATISVTYKGFTSEHPGIDRVAGGGAAGDDTFVIEPGSISGVCQSDGTVAPPVPGYEATDGDGETDCIADGAAEGDTVSFLVEFEVPLHLCGGPGSDTIGGGQGDDMLGGDGTFPNDGDTCDFGDDDTGAADDNDVITGEGGDDDMWGNNGEDVIDGGSGQDDAWGGTGIDELVGGIGPDTLNGGPDGDSISGGPESDPCPGNDRDDCGDTSADDTLNGNGGDDSMEGDHGRDTMTGGGGNDTMVGGLGDDTMSGNADFDSMFGNEGFDTINGNAGDDDIYGGVGNDTITGGADEDDIVGEEGIDTIDGGSGWDVILGDLGLVNRNPDAATPTTAAQAFEAPGSEPLVELTPAGGVPPAGGDIISGGEQPDRIWGQEGDDVIDGDGGDDVIRGAVGNDLISGNAGADVIYGDDGVDTIFGDSSTPNGPADGVDTIRGGNDGDLISGNADGDRLFGDAGDDTIFGDADAEDCANDGDDFIVAGAGNDLAFGNAADDDIFGQGGVDRLVGGSNTFGECDGDDDIAGGEQADVIAGDNAIIANALDDDEPVPDEMLVTLHLDGEGDGDHDLDGEAADDRIYGQAGADVINGGAGDDYAEGNEAGDAINGDAGDDDLIGGSSAADGINDDDRVGDGRPDDTDVIDGDEAGQSGEDYIAGDNALISRNFPAAGRAAVELFDVELAVGPAPAVGTSADDILAGGGADDRIFGQGGDDTITAGDGLDYVEGNHGDDDIDGGEGDDDLIGGGSASGGVIVAGRTGSGLVDGGESSIVGGGGDDYIAGDNARMNRVIFDGGSYPSVDVDPIVLFDLQSSSSLPVDAATHGSDNATGGPGSDLIFGQGDDDVLHGQGEPDYVEGNDGNDTITGGDGDDDLIGGGSALDGIIDPVRDGETLHDEGEFLIEGNAGVDWIMGDNAFSNRVLFADVVTPIDLFDVNSGDPDVSGGDQIHGGTEDDLIFGQGNGYQGDQSDPADGADNDADGMVDEDGDPFDDDPTTGWLGDWILGDAGEDYIEGNHGSDFIAGGDDDDDIAGGGSAIDGIIDDDRIGNGLLDARDTIHGGGGGDVIAGDNARIDDPDAAVNPLTGLLLPGTDREVLLFDVNSADNALSGGDFLTGGDDRDLVFGQGNGAQSPDQADPLDGVDNDFDGREGPDSTSYDCADNGFDNDGDTFADDDDPECTAGVIDEDQPWDGDIIHGNAGDDYLEGNHGADWMFGGDDEDDLVGGGSASDGAIVPTRDPEGLLDGPDVMHGDDEDDVMTGDNARINRVIVGAAFARIGSAAGVPEFGPYDQAIRTTDMFAGDDGDPGPDTNGDDYMTGGAGNDEIYGQLGADFLLGDTGDDGMVGDLGQVRANVLGDGIGVDPAPQAISTNSPHWDDVIYEVGSLLYETELYAFDTSAGGVGGPDVILGYDGRDTAFGGPGADIIQGDGDATEEVFDAELPEFTHMVDVDPTTADRDQLFGGDDADAIWGGRDHDILMGGHGDDHLDVRPREETDNGRNGAKFRIIPRDPPSWFTWAFPENFQDVDFIYGGWDRDALQADQAENGPDPGDRLADWAGGFNVFYLCPAGYGDHTITRMGAPHARDFLRDLTQASGAYLTATDGTSGFRDLAYVFPNQRGQNSHPPHPDHPGHFTCADYAQVGTGAVTASAGGPYQVAEGGSVALDASASTGATGFEWAVGPFGIDAPTSPTPAISAIGLDDGMEQVSVEATDGAGTFESAAADVAILNVAPVVTAAKPASVDVGQAVVLTAAFTDPGELDTHAVSIDWGDGTSCDGSPGSGCGLTPGAGGGDVEASHTYVAAGSYQVTVTVTDDDGGAGTSAPVVIDIGVGTAPVRTAVAWSTIDPWPIADALTVGGVEYTRSAAIDVFDDGRNNERSPFLFRELVSAFLNQAAGADTSCVAVTMVAADAWLASNPPGSGVKHNKAPWKNDGDLLFDELEDYNAGLLCAPGPP